MTGHLFISITLFVNLLFFGYGFEAIDQPLLRPNSIKGRTCYGKHKCKGTNFPQRSIAVGNK